MSDDAHRIRRLRWRIALGSRDEACALRARLARDFRQALLPALERALEGLAADGDVIHIPRLEAAVRMETTEALEAATADAIRAALEARLATERRSTVRHARLESMLAYLETGTLPWYAEPEKPDLDHVRELEETAVSDMTAVLQHLPTTTAAAAVFLFRLLSLLPDSGWLSVVHAVARLRHRPEEPALIEAIELIAVAPERSSGRHARLELAAAIVAGWFAPIEAPKPEPSKIKTAVSSDALRLLDRLALPARVAKPIDTPRPAADSWREAPQTPHAVPVAPAAHEPAPGRTGCGFGLPAFYAGLVVLAPFLPRLFAARNVVHPGGTSLGPEALRRAAALLHFAATGEIEGHEYKLGFIKVLLGVAPDHPVLFASGILSRGDRDEVETVLGDVAEQWYMLKHSSTDGLRHAFLQRRGLLLDGGGLCRLRVESAPADVLLDGLPWSLGTVTLPWLARPIAIDWPRF